MSDPGARGRESAAYRWRSDKRLRWATALITVAVMPWAAWQLTLVYYGKYSLLAFLAALALLFALLQALLLLLLRRRRRVLSSGRALLLSLLIGVLAGEVLMRLSGRHDTYYEAQGSAATYSRHQPPRELAHPGPHDAVLPKTLKAAAQRPPAGRWAATRTERCKAPREPWLFTGTPCSTYLQSSGEYSFLHQYNSLGLRDDEPARDRPAGEYRIVGLGDSFTEGIGAAQESTWLRSLEQLLSDRHRDLTVRTLNGGKAGSDPFFEYVLLERRLLAWQPDLVIVAVNNSDLEDVRIRGGMERFLPDGSVAYRPAPAWEPLYGMSHLVRAVMHGLLDYDWGLVKSAERGAATARSTELLLEGLIAFQELSRERGFELVLVLHPLQWELENASWSLAPLARRLGTETGVRVVDLYEYYRGPDGIPPGKAAEYYWPIDLHHNARGYALFARGVAEALDGWQLVSRAEPC